MEGNALRCGNARKADRRTASLALVVVAAFAFDTIPGTLCDAQPCTACNACAGVA
jgi:hypothetical protein